MRGDSGGEDTVCCLRTSFCRGGATVEVEGAILEDDGAALGGEGTDWTSGRRDWGAACAAAATIFAWLGCLTESVTVDESVEALEAGCCTWSILGVFSDVGLASWGLDTIPSWPDTGVIDDVESKGSISVVLCMEWASTVAAAAWSCSTLSSDKDVGDASCTSDVGSPSS